MTVGHSEEVLQAGVVLQVAAEEGVEGEQFPNCAPVPLTHILMS